MIASRSEQKASFAMASLVVVTAMGAANAADAQTMQANATRALRVPRRELLLMGGPFGGRANMPLAL